MSYFQNSFDYAKKYQNYNKSPTLDKKESNQSLSSFGQMTLNSQPITNYHYLQKNKNVTTPLQNEESKLPFNNTAPYNKNLFGNDIKNQQLNNSNNERNSIIGGGSNIKYGSNISGINNNEYNDLINKFDKLNLNQEKYGLYQGSNDNKSLTMTKPISNDKLPSSSYNSINCQMNPNNNSSVYNLYNNSLVGNTNAKSMYPYSGNSFTSNINSSRSNYPYSNYYNNILDKNYNSDPLQKYDNNENMKYFNSNSMQPISNRLSGIPNSNISLLQSNTPNLNRNFTPGRNNFNMTNNIKSKKIVKVATLSQAGKDAMGYPKTNQDSFLFKDYTEGTNFGIFDGHGYQGHMVSQAIKKFFESQPVEKVNNKEKIPQLFSDLSKAIIANSEFNSMNSGSTCVTAYVDKMNNKLICSNCGDSRAILICFDKIVQLSNDHKPDLPEEKKRIESSGGRVDRVFGLGPYRVWLKNEDYPGLAMSRSIGDGVAHSVGVSDVPEVIEYDLNVLEPCCIILASDGVWEFLTNEDVKAIVMKYYGSLDANGCAQEIVKNSTFKWAEEGYSCDDITCVIGFFEK